MRKHKDNKKQNEYDKYLSSYIMTFDELCVLVDSGIENNLKIIHKPISQNAFRRGLYLGSPGKDIYFALHKLSGEQMELLASKLSRGYPSKAPKGHLGYAACIRYIYGCFDKQGCLLSTWHKKTMAKEGDDWSKPDKFMSLVNRHFERNNCIYGQIIYNEMKAHRIGDMILMYEKYELKDEMLEYYNRAHKMGVSIKSWKHTFTPFYWAACYLEKFDKSLAIRYHKNNLKYMEKYCPDARPGYREKATHSLAYLSKNLPSKEKKSYLKWVKKLKNKCLVKVKGRFK